MNFLAHIYLSENNPEMQIGNFIADSVRQKDLEQYSKDVQIGIQTHWAIDNFTDHHDVVKESKALLYEEHHKYSAVLVDIFYDHYLAKNWNQYSDTPLDKFVNDFYASLKDNLEHLPHKINQMYPYLVRYNWLYNYQFLDGIESVLGGMSRRASFKNKMHLGVNGLKAHYADFEKHFNAFFPELVEFAKNKRNDLRKGPGL